MDLIDEQDCRSRIRKKAVKSIRAALDLIAPTGSRCLKALTVSEKPSRK